MKTSKNALSVNDVKDATVDASVQNESDNGADGRAVKKSKSKWQLTFTQKMARYFTINLLIIVAFAFFSLLFVSMAISLRDGEIAWQYVSRSLAIIFPMCTLIAVYNIIRFKIAYRHIKNINESLERISDGDFTTRVDTAHSGTWFSIYDKINIMASELGSMERMKSDFVNNYSHEFKTPVACINGFADMLLNHNPSEEDKRAYLQIIYDESKRLANLTDKSIMLAKLDNQSIVEDKKSFSLDNQLRQVCVEFSREWTDKQINLTCDFSVVTIYGNEELVKQVWLNLIANAIKFTPQGGDVHISLTANDSECTVAIKDNGNGMTETQRKHIFDRYYQADKSGNKSGLGLGLSIAKLIVDHSGGEITVESTPNEGSTFFVRLPLTSV